MHTTERLDVAACLARMHVAPRRITADSRSVRPGDAFAAFPGLRTDGRRFIGDAVGRGAAAVFWETEHYSWPPQWSVPNQGIRGLRDQLGVIADFIYASPSAAMWVVGVTGTNGKTSCTHAVARCFSRCGRRAGVMGTLGNGLVAELAPALHTTGDAATVHETLATLRDAGATVVAMEVSSHGLDQGRVNGVAFDVALFTNLSRDHLDYHGTMAAYGAAKARLFAWPGLHASVINCDDPFGMSLAEGQRARGRKVLTYGFGSADVAASNLRTTADGSLFSVATPWGRAELATRLVGAFNASNMLGVLGVLLVSGVPLSLAVEAIMEVEPPPGRMQRLGGGTNPLVVIDYAHSPDALEKVLGALRPVVTPGSELVCVFGCGGNRDAGKRAQMGEVAGRLADRVVITDDNPRDEEPAAIADAILRGVHTTANPRWALELDRARAIALAVGSARAGDVVLIAGKGHEDYQERRGLRTPFSDLETARSVLSARTAA